MQPNKATRLRSRIARRRFLQGSILGSLAVALGWRPSLESPLLSGGLPASAASPLLSTVSGKVSPDGVGPLALTAEYKSDVARALASSPDLWGEQELSKPNGPTYESMESRLKPLMLLRAGRIAGSITDSNVYYLPFGVPLGLSGRGSIALHVADGSQIITNEVTGRNLKIFVGDGSERYGNRLAALEGPTLFQGYLPILRVGYADVSGIRYQQESFATYLPRTEQLASYIKLTATGASHGSRATIRLQDFCGANCQLSVQGNRLVADGKTYLFFSPGATLQGTDLVYSLDLTRRASQSVYIVRINEAAPAPDTVANQAGHDAARQRTKTYWDTRLSKGAKIQVPETRVEQATKGLLVQNLLSSWRYSLGNSYEAFYQPECSDTVETLGHLGFTDVYRSSLEDLLPLSKGPTQRNWEVGTKMYHAVDYYRLTGDASLLEKHEATYRAYGEDLIAQNAADPNGLLERQRYSSDIPAGVYGLHQIGFAQRGIQDLAEVWRELGRSDLADRYAPFAATLEANYQDAVRRSQVTMADGSLFTPADLLDGTQPFDPITATLLGGYWDLVAHYGFGARVYAPGSTEALRTLAYVYNHGGLLLGMLRARDSATCTVYQVEELKFFADNDQADQMVLALYGKLAHGMTRNTYVSGEAHNVGPILTKWPTCRGLPGCVFPDVNSGWADDEYYRAMYLAPNSANNTTFLEDLRLMLARTVSDSLDRPTGLELAYATPRGWLEDSKKIKVTDLPTEFGTLGFEIKSHLRKEVVEASVEVPTRIAPERLSIRLRVPEGHTMSAVMINGLSWSNFDPTDQTVDLSGLAGRVRISVSYVAQGGGS